MHQRGHQVVIFCKKDSPIHKTAVEDGLPIEFISGHKKYYDFKAGKHLAKLLDDHLVSHLIVRDTRDISIAVIAKRKSKNKIHVSYFMEMQLGVNKRNLFHTIRYAYLDLWSCPLHWLAEQVSTMTRMNKTKIQVIPSGLDLSQFDSLSSRSEARTLLNLPQGKKIFGLIGRFDPHKGQVLLLEALRKIDDPNVCVCFLGEPTKESGTAYVDLMNDTISKYGLEDRVFIRPFRKDISTFFAAVDAFVMASKAETFGMVTIEAMACGVPVIASNAGGSPEILHYGKFGYLFEPLNSDDLSRKMMDLLQSEHPIDADLLKEEVKAYDHLRVCAMVEDALGL